MAAILTTSATIGCGHGGTVQVSAGQSKLSIGGAAVLVAGDLDGRPIAGCPQPNIPCTAVTSVSGVPSRLSVGGAAALLDTITGTTNGSPPGALVVLSPGQKTMHAT